MNLNAFRVFLTVYKHNSMTLAAKELHLTQSGVSQHVAALERDLGFTLFERINRRLFATAKAQELYVRGKKGFEDIEQIIQGARNQELIPTGTVKIGLPVEYGNNIVLPKLAKLGLKYPKINFSIELDFATALAPKVLEGKIDCALVDSFSVSPIIKQETIETEQLLLCGERNYVKARGPITYNTKYFSKFEYIDYQVGEPILRSWFQHHLGRHNVQINVRANIFDVEGISRLILGGLGLGILPEHKVKKLKEQGANLHVFEGRKSPLKNEICLIYLPLSSRPLAQQVVIDELRNRA